MNRLSVRMRSTAHYCPQLNEIKEGRIPNLSVLATDAFIPSASDVTQI